MRAFLVTGMISATLFIGVVLASVTLMSTKERSLPAPITVSLAN